MPRASSVHNIGGWVNFTQRWVSDVDMWGRPASPRLVGLRLAPSGTDLLVNVPHCLLKSVVGCLGPTCGVARPVTWNFHQIHPINFHCVVDGHHKSATWFPWIWLSLLRVVAIRSMVEAFWSYPLYLLVYPVHKGPLEGPQWYCGKVWCSWQRCGAVRPKWGRPACYLCTAQARNFRFA